MRKFALVKFKGVGDAGDVTFLSAEQLDPTELADKLGAIIAENDRSDDLAGWTVVVIDGALQTYDFDIQVDELASAKYWESEYPAWFGAAVKVAARLLGE